MLHTPVGATHIYTCQFTSQRMSRQQLAYITTTSTSTMPINHILNLVLGEH
jgi:hypothetical protein